MISQREFEALRRYADKFEWVQVEGSILQELMMAYATLHPEVVSGKRELEVKLIEGKATKPSND